MLFHPQNKNTPIVRHESLSQKVFMCQKKVWAMIKKEKKISMPKGHEKKYMPKSMRKITHAKKHEEKKEIKIAHTFK